ncbi:hypothetical protein EMIT0111MI5_20350 [Burkholderia sp. IT-111MI5]
MDGEYRAITCLARINSASRDALTRQYIDATDRSGAVTVDARRRDELRYPAERSRALCA